MRVLILSDIHGAVKKVRKLRSLLSDVRYDVIVVAGDLTDFGPINLAKDIIDILSAISNRIYYVAGNCDPPEMLNGIPGWEEGNLHLNAVIVEDYLLFGIGGGTITPFNTFIEFSEEEMLEMLNSLSKTLEDKSDLETLKIMVSHTPPWNTPLDTTFSKIHVGSITIREFIQRIKPILVIVGHIHEGRGVIELGGSVVVNPGPLRSGYYAEANIIGDRVNIELKKL